MRKTISMFVCIIFTYYATYSCTNFLITKGATIDGSCMITYSADSHTLYGELYFWPAAQYPDNTYIDINEWDTGKYLGKIKQLNQTFSVVGNMNEFQVSIGETTFTGREELQDTTGLIDYGSLIYLTLQRSKTAREAIQIMGQLVSEYGYYSTGESFSISDPNEVWIMEMVGKGSPKIEKDKKGKIKNTVYSKGAVWVALKVPDGYISGHANHARIKNFPLNDPNNCLYAKDVIQFARDRGYFKGSDEQFSFRDAYCPMDYAALRFCEARVWSGFRKVNKEMDKFQAWLLGESSEEMPLWIKPDFKLSLSDVYKLMRDHYEGTFFDMTEGLGAGPFQCPYRWRPMTWKVDSTEYCHERAISTQQTGFSFVAQSRSWLPNPIGGINWFGVDDTYSTVYVPMYCGIQQIPYSYSAGNGDFNNFTWEAAHWVFNWVANYAYSRYSDMIIDIQKTQSELENSFFQLIPMIDQQAAELMKTQPEKALEFITNFSVNQGNMTVARWKQLGEYLLVKYMDGNIKRESKGKFLNNGYTQAAHPKHPAYNEAWYRGIIEKNPEKFRMRSLPKK